MTCVALITSGGTGARMGLAYPKQYLELNGVPILALTLRRFQEHPLIDEIVVTCPAGDADRCRALVIARFGLSKVKTVLPGGATRQDSVRAGLRAIDSADVVAIHDGVRPFVSERVISETIDSAHRAGAALACVPVKDTVKRARGERLETVDRSDLWLAHTPQTFRFNLIREAHEAARDEGFSATDDAALVERMGHPVEIVEDSWENLKITTPQDVELARFIADRRNYGARS